MNDQMDASGGNPDQTAPSGATLHRVRFLPGHGSGANVIMNFADPTEQHAERTTLELDTQRASPEAIEGAFIDVLVLPAASPLSPDEQAAEQTDWVGIPAAGDVPALIAGIHGAQIVWRHQRAAVRVQPERLETVLTALVEFCYYEGALRELEIEVAAGWRELDVDSSLACRVTTRNLSHADAAIERMKSALQRRARFSRIEGHLQLAGRHLPILSQQVGNRLREKARIEERLETLDGQLEVAESVYEMSSQRIGEFTHSRKERRLEWVIIILLAIEVVILLVEYI